MNIVVYYIKKCIVYLFRLDDISILLEKSKQHQKELDEKYWTQKLRIEIEKLQYKYTLELQEKDAQITELENIIQLFKQKEKELTQKEYFVKKQSLETIYFANKISSKIEDFAINIMSIVGEIKGIRDEAEHNKRKLIHK